VRIRKVETDNRKGVFHVVTYSGDTYIFPYVRTVPRPDSTDRVVEVVADRELDNEAFTYTLESGAEGTVHLDQVLEYNEDPTYLRDLIVHQMTVEAAQRVERCGLSRRELARRLKTSVPQLYRLLDTANTRKSMNQLVALLQILDCDVELVVTDREAVA